ncbi:MAG TPA: hypothetical protein VLZ55_10195, partial [Rhodanobacter sp.]|nr:hypothetical protein [Rhodanobacter sp.]
LVFGMEPAGFWNFTDYDRGGQYLLVPSTDVSRHRRRATHTGCVLLPVWVAGGFSAGQLVRQTCAGLA